MKNTKPTYSIASNPTPDGAYLVDGTKYIGEIHINRLRTALFPCDKWETEASIRFSLRSPKSIKVLSDPFEFLGVILHNIEWSDEMELV